MDIQISEEKVIEVSFKNKIYAVIALIISFPLTKLPPSLIERILNRVARNKEVASFRQAEVARNSVCIVSKKCRNQDRCVKRSLATFFVLALQSKKCSWCTGYAMNPFRAHAWIEIGNIPVNEFEEVKKYIKVIKTIDDDKVTEEINMSVPIESNYGDDTSTRVRVRELWNLIENRKKELGIIFLLGILSSILTLLQPDLVSNIISSGNFSLTRNLNLYILVVVILSSTVFTTIQYYILQRISEGAIYKSRKDLIRHVLRLPIINYNEWETGDLLSRISMDTSKLRVGIIQMAICVTSGIFLSIGAIIGLALKDIHLFLITFAVITVSFIFIVIMSQFVQKTSFKAQKSLGELTSIIGHSLSGIRTVRSTNETNSEIDKALKKARKIEELGMKLAKYHSMITPISNLGLQISGIVVIGFGGYRVSKGLMDVSDLTSFILLLYIAITPFQQIFTAISSIGDALGALSRVKEITNLPLEDQYDVQIESVREHEKEMISLENVAFSYDRFKFGESSEGKELNLILRDISFTIKEGECVAIVGPSGAGKSTILQLIERFYEVNKGDIYVDGLNYKSITREELREKIVYVEQNAPLLYGSIYENLTFGNKNIDQDDCLEALRKVNLLHLVERNEKGLNAAVGENGVKLSGGEKQRLAIARVILSKAKIILLDELTSNLDSINEKMMKEIIDDFRGEKTIVIVAHRLSTTKDVDVIYVLEHGRIVGQGTHTELLDTIPLYRELAREQMLI